MEGGAHRRGSAPISGERAYGAAGLITGESDYPLPCADFIRETHSFDKVPDWLMAYGFARHVTLRSGSIEESAATRPLPRATPTALTAAPRTARPALGEDHAPPGVVRQK